MNASKFVHVTCWLVQNSHESFDSENLQQQVTDHFWSNTKIRTQRWKAELGRLEPKLKAAFYTTSSDLESLWLEFFALSDEIILSESLSRVLSAVIACNTDSQDVRDVVSDVLKDNREIKQRVFNIARSAPDALKRNVGYTKKLESLNSHLVNLMLSQLPNRVAAKPFATDENAFEYFAKCAGVYSSEVVRQANAALGATFAEGFDQITNPTTINEDINQKIVDNAVALFGKSQVNFANYADQLVAV